MIGAGTWADKQCALSGTGVGEEFIRRAAAHDVAARVKYKGCSLRQAMREVVWESFAEGDGGFVGVSADYTAVWDFNRWAELCDLQPVLWVPSYCTQWCEGAKMEHCRTCLYSDLRPLSTYLCLSNPQRSSAQTDAGLLHMPLVTLGPVVAFARDAHFCDSLRSWAVACCVPSRSTWHYSP